LAQVIDDARQILRNAVRVPAPTPAKLVSQIAQRFADVGLDEPLPEIRQSVGAPPDFGM